MQYPHLSFLPGVPRAHPTLLYKPKKKLWKKLIIHFTLFIYVCFTMDEQRVINVLNDFLPAVPTMATMCRGADYFHENKTQAKNYTYLQKMLPRLGYYNTPSKNISAY